MNFYYDLVLNFNEIPFMFYEWFDEDNVELIKKIPVFSVSNKVLKDLIYNEIIVTKDFLDLIENKCELKNKTLKYVALFASKNGTIALEFNDKGKSIYHSFLQVDDEIGVIEMLYTLPQFKLNYELGPKLNTNNNLRIENNIKNFIQIEIDSLYKKENFDKLKYLYNEWFLKDSDDFEEIYKEMNQKLQEGITDREVFIYNLIRLSYNNV